MSCSLLAEVLLILFWTHLTTISPYLVWQTFWALLGIEVQREIENPDWFTCILLVCRHRKKERSRKVWFLIFEAQKLFFPPFVCTYTKNGQLCSTWKRSFLDWITMWTETKLRASDCEVVCWSTCSYPKNKNLYSEAFFLKIFFKKKTTLILFKRGILTYLLELIATCSLITRFGTNLKR